MTLIPVPVPLENYVCREVIEDFFFKDKPFSKVRHVAVTSAIVFTSTASEYAMYEHDHKS